MLYRYEFVKNSKMLELNKHLLYFIRSIRNVAKNRVYIAKDFFHSSFLNAAGEIAPKGTTHPTLNLKFKEFFETFKGIDQNAKDEFYTLILFSKDIHLYFENDAITQVINLRNSNIKRIIGDDSFKELMNALWNYLKSANAWGIDDHYKEFFDKLPESRMCPFCGLDTISNPILFKSDYDHLAYKGDYPISSINLKNLAPSCADCNQKFKHSKDSFFNSTANRRKFFYPYVFNKKFEIQNIQFDLNGSIIPNTDVANPEGTWKVSIMPNSDLTTTWNNIYEIETRYILAINHTKWYTELAKIIKLSSLTFDNDAELSTYIDKFKDIFNPDDVQLEYHLKYAYFKFLAQSSNQIFYQQIKQLSA